MEKIFRKIAKILVYLLVFLLPLFFLPWTFNVLEFNKQALLFFLVLISLIAWLIYILTSYKIEIKKSFINLPVVLLVLTTLLSTLFSLFRYGSFWGWPLPIAPSLLSVLSFVALYFIIVNLFKKEEIPFLLLTLFVSGGLTALIFIFHIFGKFILPFGFTQISFFNTIGTVNTLAIYFAILLILIIPLLFFVKGFFKIILGIFGSLLLFSLFLINFPTGWLIFITGLTVLLAIGMAELKKIKYPFFITLLMAFLVIGIIFTFSRFSLPGVPGVPAVLLETSPSQLDSFKILKGLSLKELIIGTGPGTFSYDWARYKPVEINQGPLWAMRFSQPSSEILDRLISNGILGFLVFLLLLIVCLKVIFNVLLAKFQSDEPKDILDKFLSKAVLAGFIGLILAFFLYPANFSILFLFWLLIAFSVLLREEPSTKFCWSIDLQTSSFKAMAVSFLTVLIFVFGIGLAILYSQRYLAEVRYYQGLRAWQRGEVEKSVDYLLRASKLNPKIDLYQRDLSQIFLFKTQQLLNRTDLSQEEMTSQVRALIANAISSANQATNIDPNNVVNWNIRGFIYQNIIGIAGGAADWALSSYEKSAELEPNSPYAFTEMGRIYLIRADLFGQDKKEAERVENLKFAREKFEKAISLKSDYAPAHFLLAMIYIREGKTKEAIDKLEATKKMAASDTGLAFQLALIYYNDNQFDKAKTEFERAVLLDPNYSNARYFLGLIYDRQGNKKEAISQFEKIAELNPDNEEVKKILTNLQANKPALEGIVPGQPPVEEKPAEQLKK